ncbi:MAG: nucleotidyltransferase [Syntrophaceae bacterium]
MMELRQQVNRVLDNLADSIDISETRYKEAEGHYMAIGQWLGKEDSPLAFYNPEIYPQGSFRLGTVVKPITEKDEYDIDLVCQLDVSKEEVTQKELKQMVGGRLKENRTYKQMLDKKEGRRCWTIQYDDGAQFHMDILPTIPEDPVYIGSLKRAGIPDAWAKHAICLTDNTFWNYDLYDDDWPRSNPRGYAEWFKERMKVQFDERRKMIATRMRAGIEDVPEYLIKTPLQRSIQLLKRHRDITFVDDPDDRPISIIITTLAALAYDNQADLYEAITSIVKEMSTYIKRINGVEQILNPVNPNENFADKWQKNPDKEMKFRDWISKLQSDMDAMLEANNIYKVSERLKGAFGALAVSRAFSFDSAVKASTVTVITNKPQEIIIRNPIRPWRSNEC